MSTTTEETIIEETIIDLTEGEEGDYKLVVEFIEWTPQRLPEDIELDAAKLLMALGDKVMTCDEEELASIILFDTMVSEDRDEVLSITGVAPGTFFVAYHSLAEEEPLIILAKATLDIQVLGECECDCDCEAVVTGYYPEAWNWETQEVERHISNTQILYGACQGQDATSIRAHCEAYGIPGVDFDNVNWSDLAKFFGES